MTNKRIFVTSEFDIEELDKMENKITLPMDVSKGIQFDFTLQFITEEQAKALLDQIQAYVYPRGIVMAGGFVSVAHMEELAQERIQRWNDLDLLDSDLMDDISLDDLEDQENWEDLEDDYQSGPEDFE